MKKKVLGCDVCSYLQVGDKDVMLGSGVIDCTGCGAKIIVTGGVVKKRFEKRVE